jgi:hypothetical protein
MNCFIVQMVPIYRDEEIIQNNIIDKIKSGIFNSTQICSNILPQT